MMHKMEWDVDPKATYSLTEIVEAIQSNFNSDEPTFKKEVVVGFSAENGVTMDQLFKHPDVNTMLMIGRAREVKEKDVYNELHESYSQKSESRHPDNWHLQIKIGIVANTMACNRWAKTKYATI